MIDSFFHSSMSSVLSQWSDFRVSRNLYKSYFNMQKAENASKSKNTENTRRKIEYKNSFKKDNLGKLSDSVSSSVKSLENAFAVQKDTGEIDRDKAYSAAESFVKSYNDLVSSIRQTGDKTISGKQEFIANMANAYSRRLGNVGISIGTDGKLSIDREKFDSASADDLDKIFGKKNSFAEFMGSQASQLSKYSEFEKTKSSASTYNRSGNSKNSALTSGQLLDMLK